MISFLNGKVISVLENSIVMIMPNNGIGLQVFLKTSDLLQLKKEDSICLHVHLNVREDELSLFGFKTFNELSLFKVLIMVSGISCNTAMSILSSLETEKLINAILTENTDVIVTVKGIGLKTAKKIILDSKDRIKGYFSLQELSQDEFSQNFNNNLIKDAIAALDNLGIPKKKTIPICEKIILENPAITTENLIKKVLKHF